MFIVCVRFFSISPRYGLGASTKGFAEDGETLHARVVRKVLALRYEGEYLFVLVLTSAKVPRRGSRKLFFVLCKGGLLAGRWHELAVHAECAQTKVGRGKRRLRVAARMRCKAPPEGCRKNTLLQEQPQQKSACGSFEAFGPS